MDLPVLKLIGTFHLARHGLHEAVSLSFNLAAYRIGSKSTYHVDGSGFPSRLGALRFRNSDCLHVSIRGTTFS